MLAGSASKRVATPASEQLAATVGAFSAPAFAVVDGAQFDDLATGMRSTRLFGRSLFLEAPDAAMQASSPCLIALGQKPDAIDRVLDLVGDKPAVVFWSRESGEMALWRHLRGLNLVRIPTWAADGRDAPPTGDDDVDAREAVLFRHWDPGVLGALLPLLDATQFRRMFGGCSEIAFSAPDYGGVRRVVVDPSWPPAAPGPLTLSRDQTIGLASRRRAAANVRTRVFLKSVAASEIGDASDDAIDRHVTISYATGRGLGLSTDAGHQRWALLMLLTNGRVAHHPDSIRFLSAGGTTPDHQIERLLTLTADAMRSRRSAAGSLL